MENKEEITHEELELFLGEEEAQKIIKEANGRKIFIENSLERLDDYEITYE